MNSSGHSGQIINSQPLAGFLLTEVAYPSGVTVSSHNHQQACFCLVLQGSYVERYRETVIEGKPSHLIYRPAGEVHSDRFGEASTRCLIIEFETNWLAGLCKTSFPINEPAVYQGNSLMWLATKLRKESRQHDDFTPLAVEALMLEIIVDLNRKTLGSSHAKQPRWLKQVKEMLHENFAEPISLSGIAEFAGVHPVYLAGKFRQHYKCTIGEYVRALRVEFASHELANSDAPLADIALSAGFGDQSHFSRTFKRVTGITPFQYRHTVRRS